MKLAAALDWITLANPRGRESGQRIRRAGGPTDRRYSSQGPSEHARKRSESKSQLGKRRLASFVRQLPDYGAPRESSTTEIAGADDMDGKPGG